MKRFTILLILIISVTIAMAKEGKNPVESNKDQVCEVKGQIIDQINGEVLTGVAVKLSGSDQVVYTGFDGEFSFQGLTPGTYTLETSMVSYKGEQLTVHAAKGNTNKVEIILETVTE